VNPPMDTGPSTGSSSSGGATSAPSSDTNAGAGTTPQ
jgi:hypothetical protein